MANIREALMRQNAYKSYESEGLMDAYFYRPAGALFALAGKRLNLSPNHLTLASLLTGVLGSALLCWKGGMWPGVGLIILSGIFDASDGQLARMTGTASLAGRILDGVADYIVFMAIYVALGYKTFILHPEYSIIPILLLIVSAGISHSLQSSLFDYYRNAYVDYAARRRIPQPHPDSDELAASPLRRFLRWNHRAYTLRQAKLARSHIALGESLRRRYSGDKLDEKGSKIYRELNLPLIRLWNLLGSNSRTMVMIAALASEKPEFYFWAEVIFFNAWAVLGHRLQSRADAKFLAAVKKDSPLSG